ncbi:MAG: hypothetical protein CM15mP88_0660 [Pseudomonadota bacterium]|nr:MAG: hypothetical protein CM15mP88_0660 [Pseudomonadota bacterium]
MLESAHSSPRMGGQTFFNHGAGVSPAFLNHPGDPHWSTKPCNRNRLPGKTRRIRLQHQTHPCRGKLIWVPQHWQIIPIGNKQIQRPGTFFRSEGDFSVHPNPSPFLEKRLGIREIYDRKREKAKIGNPVRGNPCTGSD